MTSRTPDLIHVTPDGVAIIPIRGGMDTPAFDQDSYAFYSDGTESGSTIIGSANNTPSLDLDTTYLVRFLVQETAGVDSANDELQLQYRVDTGGGFGAWTDVTGSSTVVQAAGTGAGLTEDGDTTQRLGAGTFITSNGGQDEVDGVTANNGISFAGSDEVEALYAIQIVSTDVSDGDVIELRVIRAAAGGTALDTYTNTPSITVSVSSPQSVTASPGAITASGPTATVSATGTATLTASPDTITASGPTATIAGTGTTTLTASPGSITASGPAASLPMLVEASPGSVAASGPAASISGTGTATLTASPDSITMSGPTASIAGSGSATISASPATITASGPTATIASAGGPQSVTASPGSVTASGPTATIAGSGTATLTASPDSIAASGPTAAIAGSGSATLTASPGSVTASGPVATAATGGPQTITASPAAVTLSGPTATIAVVTEPDVTPGGVTTIPRRLPTPERHDLFAPVITEMTVAFTETIAAPFILAAPSITVATAGIASGVAQLGLTAPILEALDLEMAETLAPRLEVGIDRIGMLELWGLGEISDEALLVLSHNADRPE